MTGTTKNLLTLVRRIEECEELSDVWRLAQRGLQKIGFDFYVYTTVDQDFSNPFCLSNLPELFSSLPPHQDPFLQYCCDQYEFTNTGAEYLEDYDYLPASARAFISAARTFGFLSGYGVPVRLRGSARFGGFNLGTRLDKNEFEKTMAPLVNDIRFFCLITHRKIEELTQAITVSPPPNFRGLISTPISEASKMLSSREREVVYHIGHGLTRKECSELLGISHNTVSEYLKSAYRKLGVRNRVDAALKLRG